jgi:hypothetical protein
VVLGKLDNKSRSEMSPPKNIRKLKSTHDLQKIGDDHTEGEYSDISNDMQCMSMAGGVVPGRHDNFLEIMENMEMREKNLDMDRKRSSSLQDSRLSTGEQMILKRGMLKKKGLLFYNNRFVTLSIRGMLNYYDPKNMAVSKGTIDLNSN